MDFEHTTTTPERSGQMPCSAWRDLPDCEGWWWKHFGGDEAAHVIRVTAQDVESMRKWGDWRGEGIVIHYFGPIPEPALPNVQAVATAKGGRGIKDTGE
jgi:hypothetical protein